MTMELRLTTNQVMQVSGAPYTTLDRWINDGWVTPTNSGDGTGSSRQWNLMQTLAATFGYRCKQAGFGRIINETIRFIANGLRGCQKTELTSLLMPA